MPSVIVFDCEFLVSEGAQTRYWCGPLDPDPIVVQIGAIRLDLSDDYALKDPFEVIITPYTRSGENYEIPDTFVNLTGLTAERIQKEGTSLVEAIEQFTAYAGDDKLWSWGKDELNLMAISCYVSGIAAPLPASRFDNACKLLLDAQMPYEDLKSTHSHKLAAYFDLPSDGAVGHNAVDDARSVARVLQHLLQGRRLKPEALV